MGRMDRINQLMKREVGSIIQKEFQDPRLMFVTILSVEVSPDLHNAVVNYSVLGDEKQLQAIAKALESLSGYIRKLIGQRIRLRYTPKVSFVYDKSKTSKGTVFKEYDKFCKILDELSLNIFLPCKAIRMPWSLKGYSQAPGCWHQ